MSELSSQNTSQKLRRAIQQKSWYIASEKVIQQKLVNLSNAFDGFLTDLLAREDEIGNVEVLRIIKLEVGNYLVIPVFEVRSELTNQIFSYEYVSWRHGSHPGLKGSLFIERNGVIEYFIVKSSDKFATGKKTYDSVGGFLEFKNGQINNLPKTFETEIKRQLGLNTLDVKRFIDLGYVYPDIGMSNNRSSLFAATLDGDKINHEQIIQNKPNKKLSFEISIKPISELKNQIELSDDAYFLAVISRLVARGLLVI